MRRRLLVGGLLLALVACSDQAKDLYETAQFEELQGNKPHAVELYRQIVTDHPDSPAAAHARERLAALER